MNKLQMLFYTKVIETYEFLEKDYDFQRLPEIIEGEGDYRDTESIVRYMGKTIAVDISWHYASAAINMFFTELSHGKMPKARIFWGDNILGARAISLYAIVQVKKGSSKDFLLGDTNLVSLPKIRKREVLIQTSMESILQNIKNLSLMYASDVLRGDMSIFPLAMKYQFGLGGMTRGQ